VLFDSKLSFCDHILSITSAAFKSLGFVLRSAKEFGDVVTLKLLYITYVRSKLEYASLVWSPIHNIYIAQLERVQRRLSRAQFLCWTVCIPPGAFLRNFCWIGLVCSLCQTDDWSTLSFFCIKCFMDLYIVLLYSQESILGFLVRVLNQPIHSSLHHIVRTPVFGLLLPKCCVATKS
jgi:hypothetical protein